MQKVKRKIPKKLKKGIPLTIRPGHTVQLKGTKEPLTVPTGLSLFYPMAKALKIPESLDKHVKVNRVPGGRRCLVLMNILPRRNWCRTRGTELHQPLFP